MSTPFTILSGEDRGSTFGISDLPMTIGRGEERDLVLKDDRVSRLHARLELRGKKVFLVDLGSSNGTFVNENLISEVELQPGDVIRFGSTRIGFGATGVRMPIQAGIGLQETRSPKDEGGAKTLIVPTAPPSQPKEGERDHARAGAETTILSTGPSPPDAQGEARNETDLAEVVSAVVESAMPAADKRTVEIHTIITPSIGKATGDPNQLYRLLAALLERCINAMDHGSALTVRLAPGEAGMLAVSAMAEGHVHLPNINFSDSEAGRREAAIVEELSGVLEFPALKRDGAPLFMLSLPPTGD